MTEPAGPRVPDEHDEGSAPAPSAAPPQPDPPEAEAIEPQLDAILARAGDLLRRERVDEADREVAQALRLAPDDPRARNLLGLVRFRSGRYDDAYEVYRDLCTRDPDDSALRLNLGLVELRMGRHAEAAQSLRRVIEREPGNAKAQGYLGLALLRAGDLPAARAAFVAAGHTDMVRQIDEQLGAGAGAPVADAVGRASDGGLGRPLFPFEGDALGSAVAPWSALPPRALPIPLAEFIERSQVRVPAGEICAIGRDGLCTLRIEGRLHMRTTGAIASSGRLAYSPLTRRVRGRATDDLFGDGDDAMVIAAGSGVVVLGPRGGRFTTLRLLEARDVLYLRETAVVAFEETLSWENGRVPGGGPGALAVVQLRGKGAVVLRSRKVPATLLVAPGEVYYVDQAGLLGWIGQVVPQQLRTKDGLPTQFIGCSGEGALILEEEEEEQEPVPPPPF